MPRKKHNKNLWNRSLAQKAIIESIKHLEKENIDNTEGFFTQGEIKEKVLEIALDVDGNKVKWEVIKPTFYRTLKSLSDSETLIHRKEKRIDKYSPYSFYKLNRFKDNNLELRDSIKEHELESLKSVITKIPIYSWDSGIFTNINLIPMDRNDMMDQVNKIKRGLKKKWLEDEIRKYTESFLGFMDKIEFDKNIKKGYYLGYCLDYLARWIMLNEEEPTKYQHLIDELLVVPKTDIDVARHYIKMVRKAYRKKRKRNEILRKQGLIRIIEGGLISKNIQYAAISYILKENLKKTFLTKEEKEWLVIKNKLSTLIKTSGIYSFPEMKPILIIKI